MRRPQGETSGLVEEVRDHGVPAEEAARGRVHGEVDGMAREEQRPPDERSEGFELGTEVGLDAAGVPVLVVEVGDQVVAAAADEVEGLGEPVEVVACPRGEQVGRVAGLSLGVHAATVPPAHFARLETRRTGTWECPLGPFLAPPPGESEEQRIERLKQQLRDERVDRFETEDV